jgi:hypothetical protein
MGQARERWEDLRGARLASGVDPTWWIDALRSERGQALLDRLAVETLTPESELRLIPRLRAEFPAELVSAALTQARLRGRALSKFSHASRMYFTQAGLEQASSERMACHHAARYQSFDLVADLCTGIGGDLIGLAAGRRGVAVDLDPVHSKLASVNAEANGVGEGVMSVCADVQTLRYDGIPAVFVDPARRSNQRRYRPGEGDPPLSWCFELASQGRAVGIKAAPGLPLNRVPDGWETEFVSEGRELKESVLWSPALANAHRRATLLPSGLTMIERPGATVAVREPGSFLIDPDPAVTRAGLVEELGESLGNCWKIDAEIAFLSANSDVTTPFGRTLRVEASAPWSLARLKELLRALDVASVDIRKRGSAVDVDEIQKRLRLTGTRSATVVLTRVADRPWMMVCFAATRNAAT